MKSKNDEKLEDAQRLQPLIDAQKSVQQILKNANTGRLLKEKKSVTMDRISAEFAKIRDLVHSFDDPTYALFDSAFGKGSSLHSWVSATTLVGTYDLLMMTMSEPAKLDMTTKQRPRIDPNYEQYTFKNEHKSEWLKTQEANENPNLKIAQSVEQFIREQRVVAAIAEGLPVLFTEFLNDAKIKDVEKDIVNTYLDALKSRRSAYDKLELHKVIDDPTSSVEDVVERLAEKYCSAQFETYQTEIDDSKIQDLIKKYPHLTNNNDWMLSAQKRDSILYPKYFDRLRDMLDKENVPRNGVSDALAKANERYQSTLGLYDAEQFLTKITNPTSANIQQAVILELLLTTKSFSSSEQSPLNIRNSVYLENLLIASYPNLFEKDNKSSFIIKHDSLSQALGYKTNKYKQEQHLDSGNFDSDKLKAIVNWPEHLGHTINAIKPIGDNSLSQKISAYQAIANVVSPPQSYLIGQKILNIIQEASSKVDFKQSFEAYRQLISSAHANNFKINNGDKVEQANTVGQAFIKLLKSQEVRDKYPLNDQINEYIKIIELIKDSKLQDHNKKNQLDYARTMAGEVMALVSCAIKTDHRNDTKTLKEQMSTIYNMIENDSFSHGVKKKFGGGKQSEIREQFSEFLETRWEERYTKAGIRLPPLPANPPPNPPPSRESVERQQLMKTQIKNLNTTEMDSNMTTPKSSF